MENNIRKKRLPRTNLIINVRKKYGEIGEPLTDIECTAILMLHIDGWTLNELKLAFGLKDKETVKKHINRNCEHSAQINKIKLKEFAKQREYNNTVHTNIECNVIRMLKEDEWSTSLLSMIFEMTRGQIRRHEKEKCSHKSLPELKIK